MQRSNTSGGMQSNKKHKLRKTIAHLRASTLKGLSSTLHSLWTLRGAASIVLIIVLFSIIQLFITIKGKLVVVPFDVRTEQTLSPDFGAAFAASLAARLNDYRELFPSSDAQDKPIIEKYDNSFDIIESFLAALPFVSIPRLTPLNKGSTTLESVKIGPVSLPISQIIFENLAFFHTDTLRGALELFGDQITARLSLKGGESIVISVPKEEGYGGLIDRISVELLERRGWISPVPMNPTALLQFAKGLESYRNYARTGEEPFLLEARRHYEAALKADRNADLVQLHLATTEYISWDDDALRHAVTHFSGLLGSEKYGQKARIANVAAELRLMERTKGCTRKYQFMEAALREVESWDESKFGQEELDFEISIVKADLYRAADTNILPNNECHEILSQIFQNESFDNLADKATQNYTEARQKLAYNHLLSDNQKRRYADEIQLEEKYLLNDRTDFAILNKTGKGADFARAAVKAGDELEHAKKSLPDIQKRMFAPFLSGSNAESYLRLAIATRDHPADQDKFVAQAIALLKKAILEGNEETAKWAILRLADIEVSRNHTHEGLEWINAFFNLTGSGTTPFFKLVDERAFAAGILIEKPQMRCEAIEFFRKADVPESAFGRMLTEEAYRRAGDLAAAASRRSEIDDPSLNATQWLGPIIPAKMALVRAKLDAANGNTASATDILKNLRTAAPVYQNVPMLLVDTYELALLVHDDESLTTLDRAITSSVPFIRELLTAKQSTSSNCQKTTG